MKNIFELDIAESTDYEQHEKCEDSGVEERYTTVHRLPLSNCRATYEAKEQGWLSQIQYGRGEGRKKKNGPLRLRTINL